MKVAKKDIAALGAAALAMALIAAGGLLGTGASPQVSNADAAQAACRDFIDEIIDREGGGVSIHRIDEPMVRAATWEEFAGLTRPDQLASHARLELREDAADFLEHRERLFVAHDWQIMTTRVTFERGFRSAQTRTNQVFCDVVFREDLPLGSNPPHDSRVFLSGADRMDYLVSGLRL